MSNLVSQLKSSLRNQLGRRGLAVVHVAPDERRLIASGMHGWRWLRRLDIDTVVDVGANVGQFADLSLQLFPAASVHSFEPIPSCYLELQRRHAGQSRVHTYNVALADTSGTATFHVSRYSPSSSLLESTPLQTSMYPHTAGDSAIVVPTATLDSFASSLGPGRRMLVKIDVEGAELGVVRGGRAVVAGAVAVLAEVSFLNFRHGQTSFRDLWLELDALGFRYAGTPSQKLRGQDGLPLLGDCLFLSRDAEQRLSA